MSAVLELENRSIRNIYFFTFGLTITAIMEALLKGKSSTLRFFSLEVLSGSVYSGLLNSQLGGLFLTEKTKQTKYLLNMIFLGRYTGARRTTLFPI